jgi:hypothetical protein
MGPHTFGHIAPDTRVLWHTKHNNEVRKTHPASLTRALVGQKGTTMSDGNLPQCDYYVPNI